MKHLLDFPGKKANLRQCTLAWYWWVCYADFMHVMLSVSLCCV